MDVLLARILKFLNGALTYDDDFLLCTFLVGHYQQIEDWSLADLSAESGIPESSILSFIAKLGFADYPAFHERLVRHQITRVDQIRARMIGMSSEDFVKDMDKDCTDEEMLQYISRICESIDAAGRVILVGALYPMSLAVDFQTDLITFGKPVYQYHAFDKSLHFSEDDLILFISATGRAMRGFLAANQDIHVNDAKTVLITQNPAYAQPEHQMADFVLRVPGRYDGINFNYQIMKIFDLLRVHYYQQYYLGKSY
ncbi:MAG: hypothetical protein LIO92_11955 [Clostridiales bacterium]|nr:hypothetical protein [Clostridiales bacterium]